MGRLMKKIINVILAILMLFTIFSVQVSSDNNKFDEISVNYQFKRPIIKYINVENENYAKISIEDVTCFGNPGEPFLPNAGAYILLPYHTKVESIHITYKEKISLGSNYKVIPTATPIPINVNSKKFTSYIENEKI